ncbi:MAG: cytochrome c peroxidase [Planctomycetota bacterium]|nr:cytochrome c peroxidase [Planctomycetota bacterium]
MKRSPLRLLALVLPALILSLPACGTKDDGLTPVTESPGDALRSQFAGWPVGPDAPTVASEELVALGERLYHDKALSAGRDISCASCHSIDNFGQDNKAFSPGTGDRMGGRSTPSSFNAFRQIAQFWDGRAASVEEQSTMPMLTDVEHGLTSEQQIVEILRQERGYDTAFESAFPQSPGDVMGGDTITPDRVRTAIGAFERTLITHSPFDAWVEGDDGALTPKQKNGLQTFVSVGCTACHSTRSVGGHMFQKLGLVVPVESEDQGRFEVTGKDSDRQVFKVPSLLNVTETAPYMHDGSIATLAETVRHMGEVQLGQDLDAAQVQSIVSFLGALKGELQ